MTVLRYLREKNRRTQQSVTVEACSLLPQAERFVQTRYSEFERGLRPRPAQLRAIAQTLGVPDGIEPEILLREIDDALSPAAVPDPPDMLQRILAARAAR